MKIIKEEKKIELSIPKDYEKYFSDMNIAIIDIETTGLSARNSAAILIGLLKCSPISFANSSDGNKNNLEFTQLFAQNLSEEKNILEELGKAISDVDMLITFNGQSFDIPFLRERGSLHGVSLPSLQSYHFDIYKLVRNHSTLKSTLPNLKQKTIENYLGLWEHRKDIISGGESVLLYFNYLRNNKPEDLDKILLHNKDDVLNLYRLIQITEKLDFHKAMSKLGFPVYTNKGVFTIETINVAKNTITVTGFQPTRNFPNISAVNFSDSYNPLSFTFEKNGNEKGKFVLSAKNIKHFNKPLQDLTHEEINNLSKKLLFHSIELATKKGV